MYQIKLIGTLNNWLWLFLKHASFTDTLNTRDNWKNIPSSSKLKKTGLYFYNFLIEVSQTGPHLVCPSVLCPQKNSAYISGRKTLNSYCTNHHQVYPERWQCLCTLRDGTQKPKNRATSLFLCTAPYCHEKPIIISVRVWRSGLNWSAVLHLHLKLKTCFKTSLPWWASSRIYLFRVYIQSFDTFLSILKVPPSPVFTPSYITESNHVLCQSFSAKELRSGSDTGVNATHHSVVNKDPVHLHSLIAYMVDRVNRYFHPIKY